MLEGLFLLGLGLIALAVIAMGLVYAVKIACVVLWVPFKLLGWMLGLGLAFLGALIGLALLPIVLAAGLVSVVFAIVFNPVTLLIVIGVLVWIIARDRHAPNYITHAAPPH